MESKFKLIDGEFSVEEAREVIGNLFEFKINFHSKESFRSELRTGLKDEKSLSRKESLKITKNEFLTFLDKLKDTDLLTIQSEISVTK